MSEQIDTNKKWFELRDEVELAFSFTRNAEAHMRELGFSQEFTTHIEKAMVELYQMRNLLNAKIK